MWRYRELMPLFDGEEPVTLGEGWTPLLHARRLGARPRPRPAVRQGRIAQSDQLVQGARPVGGGHARARISAPRCSRCRRPGNAGECDGRLRGRAPDSRRKVFMPRDVKVPFIRECELYGAEVTLVDGLITDAGRDRRRARQAARLVRRLDARRSRTASKARRRWATSSAEQLDWRCPTGSSIRPAAAPAWSACGRRSRSSSSIGWMTPQRGGRAWCRCRPSSCAPIVRAFERGRRDGPSCGRTRDTIADGLRVPKAIGDFLVLRAVRESGGTALAVSDAEMVAGDARARHAAKASAPRPKAAPRSQALRVLLARRPRQARRHRRAVQHRRRAEVPGRAGLSRRQRSRGIIRVCVSALVDADRT